MITIIIPAYNAEKYIKNCINSVLCQTYTDYEIIAVNDGSTDNTLQILQDFAKCNKKIHIIDKKNGGVSNAKNTALEFVKGEYVTFLDSDDTLPPDALETLINLMQEDVDFASGNYNKVKFCTKPNNLPPAEFNNYEEAKSKMLKFDGYMWWQAGRLYKSSIIKENNLMFDTTMTFGEDHLFNLLYAQHTTKKIVFTDKTVYNYYIVRNGLTTRLYKNMNAIQRKIFDSICDAFDIKNTNNDFKDDYISRNLLFLTEYYFICYSKSTAVKYIKETFENVYFDVLNDDILKMSFTPQQVQLLNQSDYLGFLNLYIKDNPKKTILKKIKNKVKLLILKII